MHSYIHFYINHSGPYNGEQHWDVYESLGEATDEIKKKGGWVVKTFAIKLEEPK